MHLFGSHLLGVVIIVLSSLQGLVVLLSPGSLRIQKPQGGLISWMYNVLNLLILVAVTPLVGILLVKDVPGLMDPTRIDLLRGSTLTIVETAGALFFFFGNAILAWSRVFLGRSFRLGAVAPRSDDEFVTTGPYRLVRHPMYTAVLFNSLGLALLTQSLLVLGLSTLLAVLIMLMIPAEEAQLLEAYGTKYGEYRRDVKALIPFLF